MENKTSKYLKYAIGEIVLVVIGILIALQINNWNEVQKTNRIVNNYLDQLNSEINLNNGYLTYLIEDLYSDLNRTNTFLGKLNTKTPESVQDTVINNLIGQIGPINWYALASSTFEDFNTSGYINAIQDDNLKKGVFRIQSQINYFDLCKNEIYDSWKNQLLNYYTANGNIVMMRDSIGNVKLPETYTQHNRAAFINNRDFNNILTNRMMMNMRSTGGLKYVLESFQKLSAEITTYIQNHD